MHHKPDRRLPNAQVSSELGAADAFTCGLEDVHGVDPFTQRNLGILKDGASADGELLAARVAVMSVAVLDGRGVVGVTVRADYTIWPALCFEIVDCGLFVGEQLEEFEDVEIVVVDGGIVVRHAVLLVVIYTGDTPKL